MTPFLLVLEAVWWCSLTFQLFSWVRKKLLFLSCFLGLSQAEAVAQDQCQRVVSREGALGRSAGCSATMLALVTGAPRSPCARGQEGEDPGCSSPTWTCGSGEAAAWRPCPCWLIDLLVHFQ